MIILRRSEAVAMVFLWAGVMVVALAIAYSAGRGAVVERRTSISPSYAEGPVCRNLWRVGQSCCAGDGGIVPCDQCAPMVPMGAP